MKSRLYFQMQLPKPLDSDHWYPGQEASQIHIGTAITQMIPQNNHPVKIESIELVGTKVLPEFKERHAQHPGAASSSLTASMLSSTLRLSMDSSKKTKA